VVEGLRELLKLPTDYHVLFTASATEVWERSIQNLVEARCYHFVNGAFSKRYCEIARQLQKNAVSIEASPGSGFQNPTSVDTELICLTHNETSTGVSMPMDFIRNVREANKNALIIVDAVSSLPYPSLDYNSIDSAFFSVQKAFGLPAGLGVWLVNERCLAKAEQLSQKGINTGSYHALNSLYEHSKKFQTPETPNVLGIYLLSKVIDDFCRRGITVLRRETEYKTAILYQCLNEHKFCKPLVADAMWQSKTVIVADTGTYTAEIGRHLNSQGLSPGDGYGAKKSSQLRFANFPAHSKEQYELLVDTLQSFQS
jgi:phosphoserine aminotransferase